MNTSRRPSLLWRLFVLGGVGTATAVSVNDAAWEKWQDTFGDAIPREAFRNVVAGTAGLHAVEAGFALLSARRHGVEKPGRWAFSTLLWGFPVLRRLRKVKKAGNAPATLPTGRAAKKASKKAAKKGGAALVAAQSSEQGHRATKKAAKKAAKAAPAAAAPAGRGAKKAGKKAAKSGKKAAKTAVAVKAAEAGADAGKKAGRKAAKASKKAAKAAVTTTAGRKAVELVAAHADGASQNGTGQNGTGGRSTTEAREPQAA